MNPLYPEHKPRPSVEAYEAVYFELYRQLEKCREDSNRNERQIASLIKEIQIIFQQIMELYGRPNINFEQAIEKPHDLYE